MKKTEKTLFGLGIQKVEVTDKLVEYYQLNPQELDLIIDKEDFHIRFLLFFFSLGLVLTIGSRVLEFFLKIFGEGLLTTLFLMSALNLELPFLEVLLPLIS